jgi:hypothetical protein
MRWQSIIVIAVTMAFVTAYLSEVSAESYDKYNNIADNRWSINENLMQQENETESHPVTLYLYGNAESGELKTEFPVNGSGNSAPPARYGGVNTPRHWAWKIGEWYTVPFTRPMTMEVSVSGSLWATGNAQDVCFYINIHHNGEEIKQIDTDTKNVGGEAEFPFSGSLDDRLEVSPGDTLAIWIYGGCRMGSDYELSWGSTQHASQITFICNPMVLSINEPLISEEEVVFSATILDAFLSSALCGRIIVTGSTTVTSLTGPGFIHGANGTVISWIWDYKTDNGKSGDYTIIISVSYSENEENEFNTMGKYIIEFPKGEDGENGILSGIGWLLPVIIVVVVIGVSVVAFKIVQTKREE